MTALAMYAAGVILFGYLAAREVLGPPWPSWRALLFVVGVTALWPLVVVAGVGLGLWWCFSPWEQPRRRRVRGAGRQGEER